jgi:hypothetical protein
LVVAVGDVALLSSSLVSWWWVFVTWRQWRVVIVTLGLGGCWLGGGGGMLSSSLSGWWWVVKKKN